MKYQTSSRLHRRSHARSGATTHSSQYLGDCLLDRGQQDIPNRCQRRRILLLLALFSSIEASIGIRLTILLQEVHNIVGKGLPIELIRGNLAKQRLCCGSIIREGPIIIIQIVSKLFMDMAVIYRRKHHNLPAANTDKDYKILLNRFEVCCVLEQTGRG
jgi:hypothetical protein